MKTFTFLFSKNTNPEPIYHRSGETSGGGGGGETPVTLPPSSERETISGTADGESDETPPPTATSGEVERKRALMEKPPTDDVCPICFGNFDVPCRAPCGHWYCGEIFLSWVIQKIYRIMFVIHDLKFTRHLRIRLWTDNLFFSFHYLPI